MTVNKQLSLIALSLAIIASTGCTTSQMREMNAALPWNKQEALELERVTTPTRIASIWSHDVLTGPNHEATQGFGGRLYFYNNEQQAVAATGKLVVYAFNDTESKRLGQTASEQANRKYVFSPDEFAQHYSESEIGPSYSVWLPWQRVGGPQQHVTLIAVLVTKDGKQIVAQPSRATLPGRAQPGDRKVTIANGQLEGMPNTMDEVLAQPNHADQVQRNKRTTTLPLSRNLTRHLNNAPPAEIGRSTVPNQQASAQFSGHDLPKSPAAMPATNINTEGIPQTRGGPIAPNAATIQRYQRQQSARFQSPEYQVPASEPTQQDAYPVQYQQYR